MTVSVAPSTGSSSNTHPRSSSAEGSSSSPSPDTDSDLDAYFDHCRQEGIPASLAEMADEECRRTHDKWWGSGGIARWLEEQQSNKSASDEKGGSSAKLGDVLKEEDVAAAAAMETARRTAEAMEEARRRHPGEALQTAAPLLLPGSVGTADPLALARLTAKAKADALRHLRHSKGDTSNPRFLSALHALTSIYRGTGNDARDGGLQRMGSSIADIGWADNMGVGAGTGLGMRVEGSSGAEAINGDWTILSKPSFPGCLGNNSRGEYMYGLGRMSFDMFRPTNLRCSIRNIRTEIGAIDAGEDLPIHVPAGLREEIEKLEREGSVVRDRKERKRNRNVLRTYNIIVNFTIEPRDSTSSHDNDRDIGGPDPADPTSPAPSSPLHATMRNEGYMLSDPDTPNRLTVWFTGGELAPRSKSSTFEQRRPKRGRGDLSSSVVSEEPASACSSPSCPLVLHECRRRSELCHLHGVGTRRKPVGLPSNASLQWEDIFGPDDNWKRTWGEKAKALAAKVILGAEVPRKMEEDGTMRYSLHRPVGGHGSTFVDVLYLDRDLSITRGNAGTIFVQARSSPNVGASSPGAFSAGMGDNAVAPNQAVRRAPSDRSGRRKSKSRTDKVRKAAAA